MSWSLRRLKPSICCREEKHPLKKTKSRNGTFINRGRYPIAKKTEHKLASGDIISFGCMHMCHDGRGCFCYLIEKDKSFHNNALKEQIAQEPDCSELKPKLFEGNKDIHASEGCHYEVDVRNEIAQLQRSYMVEKQTRFEEDVLSDDERCPYDFNEETTQVRHKEEKRHCVEETNVMGADARDHYHVDLFKKRTQVGCIDGFAEKLKRQREREDARTTAKSECHIGRETVQVRQNVEKQKCFEKSEDESTWYHRVGKETTQVRHNKEEKRSYVEKVENTRADARDQYPVDLVTEVAQIEDLHVFAEKLKHHQKSEDAGERGECHIVKETSQVRHNEEKLKRHKRSKNARAGERGECYIVKETAQVRHNEEKQKFLERNDDTSAGHRSQCHIGKETAQVRHCEEKQKRPERNEDTSAGHRSQCHIGKETAQVRHSEEKQKHPERNEDTSAGHRSQCHIGKETAQVRHSEEKQKHPERNEDTSAGHRNLFHVGKETAQVRHNEEKQKRPERNEDTSAGHRNPFRVRKETAQVRHHEEKQKRPERNEDTSAGHRSQCHVRKETAHVLLSVEKQKHPEEKVESPYHIDVTKEITQARRNLVEIQTRAKENEDFRRREMEDTLASKELERVLMEKMKPAETIPQEPPGRVFIKEGFSFCSFNADSLEKPSSIEFANTKDAVSFFQYVRKSLQDLSEENLSSGYYCDTPEKERADKDLRKVLTYILSITSVHQDEFIVESGVDLLLEFNGQWEVTQRTIRNILLNWGADIDLIMPSSGRPAARTLENNVETVSERNVIAVLRVLSAQLKIQNRAFDISLYKKWNEFLFGLLVLLSLDNKFSGCFSEVLSCFSALLDNIDQRSDPNWVYEYSKKLLELEADHYNLTSIVCCLLNGSFAAECLRVNTSFAAIQRILGASMDKINFQFDRRGRELDRLGTTLLATMKPLDIYCLLIFMDIIVRHLQEFGKPIRKYFKWLERLDLKIGINPHLNALVSTYRVLWDVDSEGT